ncbi:hypothetical protein [Pedobacter sp. P26]|uniref:hypothetical protein n=1 Tax=Pedobacter sp. P26 TaxID=3423956 RepID=UPI003D667C24
MNEAYANHDFLKISQIIHRIKPSIDNMGIVCIKEELNELEKFSVVYGESERAEYLLEKIKQVLNLVVHELQGTIKI